jgi:hypothetical protein
MTHRHDGDDAGPSTLPSAREQRKRPTEPLVDSEALRVVALAVLPWVVVATAAAAIASCLG